MTRANEYRVKAGDMAARAKVEADPFQQAEYERLSLAYLRLADQADKNSYADVGYETPPQQPQRQVQQQQQPQPDKRQDSEADRPPQLAALWASGPTSPDFPNLRQAVVVNLIAATIVNG